MLLTRTVAGHSVLSFLSFPRWDVASCHAGAGVRWKFQMGGSRFPWTTPNSVGGRWHQVAGRRISNSKGQSGVDGVNRVLGPRMQRPHDEHQIQTRRWRLHVGKSPVWRRHWRPWGIIWVQKWTLSVVEKSKAKQAAKERPFEGTVGSHRRFHQTVTAPHPEVGSRTRSRNGVSEFSVTETGTFRLRAKVAQLEVTVQVIHQRICGNCNDWGRQAQGVGCDDDVIPNDPQDLDEWIGAKMLELRDVNEVGDQSFT